MIRGYDYMTLYAEGDATSDINPRRRNIHLHLIFSGPDKI